MPTIIASTVGQALRDARKAAGLNLRQVEAKVGVNKSTLSRTERNLYPIRPRLLMHLAQIYSVSATDLFALAGYVDPDSLPDIETYLQLKYGVSEELAVRVTSYLDSLISQTSP